uniref:Uncharacterized protein n=1 Tax=Arundo donax TaxID=35708 RepID=A0A0A9GI02_ARUDO
MQAHFYWVDKNIWDLMELVLYF